MLDAPPPDSSTDATFVTSVHATDSDLEESYSDDAGPELRVRP
ncbi:MULTISPECIES: hypothetical protein [unclassified Saccharopolyspora]|nr:MULTISPECIES: hypothetical protein [unclassified Saccharopolyspora]